MILLITPHLYINLLFAGCIITVGGVIWWALNNSDIDPGQPNARSE